MKQYYCKYCKIQISKTSFKYGNQGCSSCSAKHRSNRINKDKVYYCKAQNCDNKINYKSFYYGSAYCGSCASKNRIRFPVKEETKEKIRQSLMGRKRPNISKGMKGTKNLSYKNGKSKCINCQKPTTNYTAKHCLKCYKDLELYKGVTASNYIHGEGNLPYSLNFSSKLKLKIRIRDSFTCQNCNIEENEHKLLYGAVLTIHHIDYDKLNCKEENLITICKKCNSTANGNRNYWEKYYKELIQVKVLGHLVKGK